MPGNLICASLVHALEDDKNSFSKARRARRHPAYVLRGMYHTRNNDDDDEVHVLARRVSRAQAAACKIPDIVKGSYLPIWQRREAK